MLPIRMWDVDDNKDTHDDHDDIMPSQGTLQNHPPKITHEYQACYNALHKSIHVIFFSTLPENICKVYYYSLFYSWGN